MPSWMVCQAHLTSRGTKWLGLMSLKQGHPNRSVSVSHHGWVAPLTTDEQWMNNIKDHRPSNKSSCSTRNTTFVSWKERSNINDICRQPFLATVLKYCCCMLLQWGCCMLLCNIRVLTVLSWDCPSSVPLSLNINYGSWVFSCCLYPPCW